MNDKYIENITKDLNGYLSDLHVLYAKLHNFHWNVVGEGFFTLHVKLEGLYEGIASEIDEVAERIKIVGGRPFASLTEYVANASLKEVESKDIHSKELIVALREDFTAMLNLTQKVRIIASEADDAITVAMLESSIANYQKNLWMLQAYLK